MIRGARTGGARELLTAGSLAAALWSAFGVASARAADELAESNSAIRADVAVAGPEPAVLRVRSVVTELLERAGVVVSTSSLDRIRPDAVLVAPTSDGRGAIGAWIDVGPPGEVLLYFRDASAERFALRRLALDSGLDEVAVEAIGQIVKSVVLALAAGDEPTLTMAQARAVLRPVEHATPRPAPAAPKAPRRLTGEVGVGLLGQLFSPEIPVSPRLDLRLTLLVDHDRGPPGPLGGWLSAGYGGSLQFRSTTIDLDLTTVAVRAGALWAPWHSTRVVTRVGVGGGIDLVDFTPEPVSSGVEPAPAGRFVSPVGTVVAELELEVLGPLWFGAGAEVDFYPADVHYDLQQANGRVRLLVPYRVRPGLMLAVGASF